MKRALITGVGGQDGSLLAELLVESDYSVVGVVRRPITERHENLEAFRDRIKVEQVDMLDQAALERLLRAVEPDEIYNLASVSFVPASWEHPVQTAQLAAVGVTTLLEAVRATVPAARFYQASSSEIFGEPGEAPQDEETRLAPLTPYGVAKAYGHLITSSYRRRYRMHASSGILYNHESPRRPMTFVPRKIAYAAAAISLGLEEHVTLGDLQARRDWGYAGDYVRAMWLMLQQDEADDYVIATGETHSVADLVEIAFDHVGLDPGAHVRVDPALVRGRAELHHLVGNSAHARERLGWAPSITFEQLIGDLVDADLDRLRREPAAIELPPLRRAEADGRTARGKA